MNDQNRLTFVKALNRTNDNTVGVFAVKTRFCNDMGHFYTLSIISNSVFATITAIARKNLTDEPAPQARSFKLAIPGQVVVQDLVLPGICELYEIYFDFFQSRHLTNDISHHIETQSPKFSG